MMSLNTPVLAVEGIAVSARESDRRDSSRLQIVREASFDLADGEILGLVGASGSGKSTLLKAVARLIEPDSGRVLLQGQDWNQLNPFLYRRAVCLLPQVPIALPGTVEDNLRFVFKLHRNISGVDAGLLLKDVNLHPVMLNQVAESMSVGEKQRLALARALALNPRVLLLDEPTSALDDANAHQVLDLLSHICLQRGLSAILTTHNIEHLRISHRRLRLQDGRVMADG